MKGVWVSRVVGLLGILAAVAVPLLQVGPAGAQSAAEPPTCVSVAGIKICGSGDSQLTTSADGTKVCQGGDGSDGVTIFQSNGAGAGAQSVVIVGGCTSPGVPPPTGTPPSATATPSPGTSFRLCGGPDPVTAHAIEQLVAGRGFASTLRGRPDGCADLTITVWPDTSGAGRQVVEQSVGTGPAGPISVRIVSEGGVTTVALGG
jgi:hypothetical protein